MPVVKRNKSVRDIPVPDEIEAVIKMIRKNHGDNTVVRGVDVRQPFRIRTNNFIFDYATLGGIPHNRMTMVHGPKHSGKTTMLFRCLAGAQMTMPDQRAVLLDIEGTYDAVWSAKNKVDNESLILVHPDTGEQAVDIAVGLIHAKETSILAIDSIAALLPIKEEEASALDSLVGQQSRLITSMLRKVSAALITERKRGHFVSVIFANQQRSKIGGYTPPGMEPMSLPGGKATGFFTSLESRFKNKETINSDGTGAETISHNDHAFTIEKNKMNAGIRSGEYRLLRRDDPELGLEEGDIDDAGTMLTFAKRLGWYEGTPKKGFVLEFSDFSEKFDNADQTAKYLYANREVYENLRIQLIAYNAIQQKMPEDFVDYLLGN
jgi:recombination protein RecA